MSERSALHYPLLQAPDSLSGEVCEVADGVLWLRLPLIKQLPWINGWAIDDGAGWAVIDTGVFSPECEATWMALLANGLLGRPVTRVFATHWHQDHCGMAGWLCERSACELWMARDEYYSGRVAVDDTPGQLPPEIAKFYRAAGWDEVALDRFAGQFGNYRTMTTPLPKAFRRVRDGDVVQIGHHRWQCIVGTGHSPEHACWYSPGLKVLISDDQILPTISSNVSVYPIEPHANPLRGWLGSLAEIAMQVPDETLVLPAHHSPFYGLHKRIRQLIEGHRTGLEKLLSSLGRPKRAIDVFPALFGRAIPASQLSMATGESLAHLHYLLAEGKVEKTLVEDTAYWQAASAQGPVAC